MNLKKWIVEYYTIHRRLTLKAGTIRSYLSVLNRIPEEWTLEDINRNDLQILINRLSDELAPSTVHHVYQVIYSSVIDSVFYGYSDKSIEFNRIVLPKITKSCVGYLSQSDLDKLMPGINNSIYCDVYNFLLNTGVRFGELAGIDCCDVVLDDKCVGINKNYYRGVLYSPKTQAGVRVMPLNSHAFNAVINNMKFGSQPLFSGLRNNRISYNSVIKDFHNICAAAKLKKMGLHIFRHTFATNLLEKGVPLKVISELLGHKSIAITANIYTDVSLKTKYNAVIMLEKMGENGAKNII